MTKKERAALLALAEVTMQRFEAIRERQRHHVQDFNAAMLLACAAVRLLRFRISDTQRKDGRDG